RSMHRLTSVPHPHRSKSRGFTHSVSSSKEPLAFQRVTFAAALAGHAHLPATILRCVTARTIGPCPRVTTVDPRLRFCTIERERLRSVRIVCGEGRDLARCQRGVPRIRQQRRLSVMFHEEVFVERLVVVKVMAAAVLT